MKSSIKCLVLIITVTTLLTGQEEYRFFINNINMPMDNRGVLADVNIPPNGNLGRYQDIGFLWSGGFFISGNLNDSLWANSIFTYGLVEDYQPGIVGSDPQAPENIIYLVSAEDPDFGQSWQDWSDAVDLGADFYDGDGDGIYNPVDLNNNGTWDKEEDRPDLIGDLTAWCVYNDGVPAPDRRWDTEPYGIEIQQTVFAFDNSHPVFSNTENTIFIRYRIINKGTITDRFDSVYFSIASDFDIGSDYSEDLGGCDIALKGSYGYKIESDPAFGEDPPAIFHHFLQQPHTFIPGETYIDNNGNNVYDSGIDTPLDTAYYYRGPKLGVKKIIGAKNQIYSSSVFYLNAFSPSFQFPINVERAHNSSLGLTAIGDTLDPCDSLVAKVYGEVNCEDVNPFYWSSGDPVNNIGWISIAPWNLITAATTGPFELNESEYYDIISAYTLGDGVDPINSISVARQNVNYARQCYNSNFGQFPVSVKDEEQVVDDFQLYQNYPNPFNPTTTIKFTIHEKGSRSPIEEGLPAGRQGGRGVLTKLIIYDILGREVTTIVNELKQPGIYEVHFDASELSSGIYFYKLTAGSYSSVKKMILIK